VTTEWYPFVTFLARGVYLFFNWCLRFGKIFFYFLMVGSAIFLPRKTVLYGAINNNRSFIIVNKTCCLDRNWPKVISLWIQQYPQSTWIRALKLTLYSFYPESFGLIGIQLPEKYKENSLYFSVLLIFFRYISSISFYPLFLSSLLWFINEVLNVIPQPRSDQFHFCFWLFILDGHQSTYPPLVSFKWYYLIVKIFVNEFHLLD
jgi:hypothetical protein